MAYIITRRDALRLSAGGAAAAAFAGQASAQVPRVDVAPPKIGRAHV